MAKLYTEEFIDQWPEWLGIALESLRMYKNTLRDTGQLLHPFVFNELFGFIHSQPDSKAIKTRLNRTEMTYLKKYVEIIQICDF